MKGSPLLLAQCNMITSIIMLVAQLLVFIGPRDFSEYSCALGAQFHFLFSFLQVGLFVQRSALFVPLDQKRQKLLYRAIIIYNIAAILVCLSFTWEMYLVGASDSLLRLFLNCEGQAIDDNEFTAVAPITTVITGSSGFCGVYAIYHGILAFRQFMKESKLSWCSAVPSTIDGKRVRIIRVLMVGMIATIMAGAVRMFTPSLEWHSSTVFIAYFYFIDSFISSLIGIWVLYRVSKNRVHSTNPSSKKEQAIQVKPVGVVAKA